MSKYVVKLHAAQEQGKSVEQMTTQTHPLLLRMVNPFNDPDCAALEVLNTQTGKAPEKVSVNRAGNDLELRIEDDKDGGVVALFKDYYPEGGQIVGLNEAGEFVQYQALEGQRSLAELPDGVAQGFELGSSAADMGMCVVAGDATPPWTTWSLLGSGLLAAAAFGGSGGASEPAPAPSPEPAPAPSPAPVPAPSPAPGAPATPTSYADDVGAVTSATSTAPTTDDATPGIQIGTGLTDTPTLYVDGVATAATYDITTGTLTPTGPLSDGPHSFTYTLSDASGNESVQSGPLLVTIDTAAPAVPAAPHSYADNVGPVTSDASSAPITDDTTPGLNIGTVDGTPLLYVDGVEVAATYDAAAGTLTPSTPLSPGNHNLSYTLTNALGAESPQSTPLALTIDNTAGANLTVSSVDFVSATQDGAGGFNKVIDEGDVITLSVTMSENVVVDTAGGTPTLSLNIGGVQCLATYDSVAGNVMTFKYNVTTSNFDHDGIQIDADMIALNGATISDVNGYAATLTHAAVAADSNYRVDTIDLGGSNGLLIRGAQAEGDWYFVWDRNGDGTALDYGNYSTMSALNGQTMNGVALSLAEAGVTPIIVGFVPGTAVADGTTANPTYDGLLAVWDAHNGSGTSTALNGSPNGWASNRFWTSSPSPAGHALVNLSAGYVYNSDDAQLHPAIYQVL
ncbi:MAG TPA: hypothetical protein VIN35_04275 [Hydrogenophaga sp.]